MPADAAQLLFLGGIVCLIISQHSRWWTQQLLNDLSAQLFKRGESNEQIRVNLALFLSFARYPLIFASMADTLFVFGPVNGQSAEFSGGYVFRSEERRVGKECRSRGGPYH